MGGRGDQVPLRLSTRDTGPLMAPGRPLLWLSPEGSGRRLQGSQERGVWGARGLRGREWVSVWGKGRGVSARLAAGAPASEEEATGSGR